MQQYHAAFYKRRWGKWPCARNRFPRIVIRPSRWRRRSFCDEVNAGEQGLLCSSERKHGRDVKCTYCSKASFSLFSQCVLLIFCHQSDAALLNEMQHVISLCACRGLRPEDISRLLHNIKDINEAILKTIMNNICFGYQGFSCFEHHLKKHSILSSLIHTYCKNVFFFLLFNSKITWSHYYSIKSDIIFQCMGTLLAVKLTVLFYFFRESAVCWHALQ